MKNCTECKWWQQWGCDNTNWITGKVTDPADPVCGGLSFTPLPTSQTPACKTPDEPTT